MARNDSDVSADSMRNVSIEAVSLCLSIYQGKSRELISFLNQIFTAYEGTSFARTEKDYTDIRMDIARVVASQSVKRERQAALVASCTRVLEALNADPDFEKAIAGLNRNDISFLETACDQYVRLGMTQYRVLSDNLGIFPHMSPSGILLENSMVCGDKNAQTPGIYNDLLPLKVFTAYVATKHLKALRKKLEPLKNGESDGPVL